MKKNVYIVGTFDTKANELNFVKSRLEVLGVSCISVDVSTLPHDSQADIKPADLNQDLETKTYDTRGESLAAMGQALKDFLLNRKDIAGVIGLGGSGGTSLISQAFQALPVGLPKIIVSTMASGNINPYIGASDIYMVYSITDINGINSISNTILANAAHALTGMVLNAPPEYHSEKPQLGLTMFGVTTSCVNTVVKSLEDKYDCLVFHATGVGGQSLEKLVDSGFISGVLDITTTEICDHLMGGVLSAGEDRIGAIIRNKMPYVGSVGALDMVNFGAMDTVPEAFKDRNLYRHNDQVTLMRTSIEENKKMGLWIANKLNQTEGEVRFLLPEKGVSAIDIEGMSFYDPEADKALFDTLESNIKQTSKRQLIRLPYNINDDAFAEALVKNFEEVMSKVYPK